MVKLQVLYGHPKDPAAFEAYYRDPHTPIAVKVPGLRRFDVGKVVGAPGGGQPAYYRTADLFFDDMNALQAALSSPEGQAAANDLANFATGGVTLMVVETQDLLSK
ncbi:MAG: hypothetical protein QOG38_1414 [Hyphomicrobiales bacterium]|jgi:uncharacterized protein (TIGR02118 family)|nr:hypothetical protein [Hyphomicrobiales bacterium]